MQSFSCEICGRTISFPKMKKDKNVFDDNIVMSSFSSCRYCNNKFFAEECGSCSEIIYYNRPMKIDFIKDFDTVFVSYVPALGLIGETKRSIDLKKKKSDISVGFFGWEDIVLDKNIANQWYMTANTPPRLDLFILNLLMANGFEHNVVLSYFPSLLIDNEHIGFNYRMLDGRDKVFFENNRSFMLESFNEIYIGVK